MNLSILKFLGFEQILKNSLTGLPMGGGKGGSDFDPKGKSDREVMRFCQSFMTELQRHIGQLVDVPAGDIGVGGREIGYLFGQYKRIRDSFDGGVLTGKGLSFGGSLTRNEATGYGLCYLTEEMLHCMKQESLQGKRVAISGSGNVAIFACQKAQELGARVITMSDSNGSHLRPGGHPAGCGEATSSSAAVAASGSMPSWSPAASSAATSGICGPSPATWPLPCATQNEIDAETARRIVRGGAMALAEGPICPAPLPPSRCRGRAASCSPPAKAANAGGVAVSGLEMCQNSMRLAWTFDEVDQRLHQIMLDIFHNIYDASVEYGVPGNLLDGANIAGFRKVAGRHAGAGCLLTLLSFSSLLFSPPLAKDRVLEAPGPCRSYEREFTPADRRRSPPAPHRCCW